MPNELKQVLKKRWENRSQKELLTSHSPSLNSKAGLTFCWLFIFGWSLRFFSSRWFFSYFFLAGGLTSFNSDSAKLLVFTPA